MDNWHKVCGLLIIGYLCLGRSFAYLGLPSLKIFIGEIVLAAFVILKPRVALGSWITAVFRSSPLSPLALAMLAFVLYGVFQVTRGVTGSGNPLETLKYFVFNYYTLYLLFGIWMGLRAPMFLPRFVHVFAWMNGVYGILFILGLSSVTITVPGSDIGIFGQPGGGAVAIIGLICVERNLARIWMPLTLNIIVTLAMQVRAEWLGLAMAMLCWGLLTGRLGKVFAVGLAGLMVLGMIELADIKIAGRSGSVSLGNIIGRVIAPIDEELAKEFTPNAEEAAGTMAWRQKWWDAIWRSTQTTPVVQAFGHGYGFDLLSIAPADVRNGQVEVIRTPHNVFYYALGYTGWVGVILFSILQFTILAGLWRSYRYSGQIVGLLWWIMGMSMSFFSNYFETPFGAIPFYLLAGLGLAPGLQGSRPRQPQLAHAQPFWALNGRDVSPDAATPARPTAATAPSEARSD